VGSSWRSEDWPRQPDVSILAILLDAHNDMGQNRVWNHADCNFGRSERSAVWRNRDQPKEGTPISPAEIKLTHYQLVESLDQQHPLAQQS
jgi:hypothetical protein